MTEKNTSLNEELERKAKTLIAIGLDMLLVLTMEKHGLNYRKHLLSEIKELIKDTLAELEQQYYVAQKKVLPLDSAEEIKYLVKNLEAAIDHYVRCPHDN